MKKIEIKAGNGSKILIERGILDKIDDFIPTSGNKFLICNKTVYPLYGGYFKDVKGVILIEDGEEFKTFDTYKQIIDKLLEAKIERTDTIIALGGGVVGDIAGFCASTILRGVNFVQVPTTLLSQTDSAIGGKTGVNTQYGKNQIGTFYMASLILIDPNALQTLDLRQIKTGLAEVIKYSLIEKNCGGNCGDFFNFLLNSDLSNPDLLDKVVYECAKMKAFVVDKDLKEANLRAFLNFGHTFAHAIEKITNFETFTHGEAVAMGMKMALKLALSEKLITEHDFDLSLLLLKKFELDLDLDKKYDRSAIIEAFCADKKIANGKLNFILPVKIGHAKIVQEVDFAALRECLG